MGGGATTGERFRVHRAGARHRSPGGLMMGRGPGRIAWLAVAPALLALAAPLPADAQPAPRVARVGYLSPLSAGADAAQREAFREGLRALGYVEGRTVVIEDRYADGRFARLPDLAAALVRLEVDVIVAAPTPAVRAARDATQTIPIVMAFSGDPVGEGFAASLARPGSNITGLSATVAEMMAKRIEFLKAIVPRTARVAFVSEDGTPRQTLAAAQTAGRALSVHVDPLSVGNARELERAFSTLRRAPVDGMIVSLTLKDHWSRLAELAVRQRLPTVSGPSELAEAGGLMAYGPHFPDLFRRAATYVDKILKGARPGDLPVEQPTKFELVINRRTARALGLAIPRSLVLQADRVID